MSNFKENYSKYYDIIYTNKNYKKETKLIKKIIKKYSSNSKDLLDMGCGTGKYSSLLTKQGFKVTGIDKSKHMIKIAREKFKENKKLNFLNIDLLNYRSQKKFAIISALFHILSYQIENNQIDKFFKNSNNLLIKNGILIFDFWFLPGVTNLKQPNKFRVIKKKDIKILRLTESKWIKNKNRINDIHQMYIFKDNKIISNFNETHKMRYFNMKFIKQKLIKHKFKFIKSLDLDTGFAPSNTSWGALVIAKKIYK